jgi:hypothetical protein
MGLRINKAYFLVPLVYIAVIFGLAFVQFSRGFTVTETIRDLQLSALSQGKNPPKLSQVQVRYKGLEFAFGGSATAALEISGAAPTRLVPKEYRKDARGFEIVFENNVAVKFIQEGASLVIQPYSTAKTAQRIKSLAVPFAAVGGAQAGSVERMPILSVSFNQKNYFLTLPGRSSRIDMARKLLVFAGEGDDSLAASMAEATSGSKDSFFTWYANQGSANNRDAFVRKIAEYVNRSFDGWKGRRFSPETGTWLTEKGNQEFRETTAMAWLAESARRGGFEAVLQLVHKAADRNPGKLGFLSSPFFGNLIEATDQQEKEDARESARLVEAMRARDLGLFNRFDLVTFMADRAPAAAYEQFLKFCQETEMVRTSRETALGMVQNSLVAASLSPEAGRALARFYSLLNSSIFPSIVKIKEGFFLESDPGRIDIELSIKAGQVLMQAGRRDKDELLEAAGRDLVMSALNFSDEQGFLPRLITHQDQALKGAEGRIAPEAIYPVVADNPWYPRFISLSARLGPGSWMYAAAPVELNIAAEQWRLVFSFPNGSIQHAVLKGVRPWKELQLWGIVWRLDRSFERYPIGAMYAEDRKLFYLKYQHKKEQQEVLFKF